MLILRTVRWGPPHGYGIGQTLRAQSDKLLKTTGSLYPALQWLEKQGWVTSEWKQTERNQRTKDDRLTVAGTKGLLQEESKWKKMARAVAQIMWPEEA